MLTRNVDPGQTVAASLQAPVLFTLAEDLRQMELQVDVDEADVGQVKVGQKATLYRRRLSGPQVPGDDQRCSLGSETIEGVVTYKAMLTSTTPTAAAARHDGHRGDRHRSRSRTRCWCPMRPCASRRRRATARATGELPEPAAAAPAVPRGRASQEDEPAAQADASGYLRDGVPTAVTVDDRFDRRQQTEVTQRRSQAGEAVIVDQTPASAEDGVMHDDRDHAPLIELRGVTKIYGEGDGGRAGPRRRRPRDRSAASSSRSWGRRGSGKSTTMNIIGCLDTPTTGGYLFQGVDVGALTRDQRALLRRHCLGFVFQGFNLLARTTALENVELPLIYRGMSPAQRRRARAQALDRSVLPDREHHTPSRAFRRPAAARRHRPRHRHRPAVLLADEPTGNLDTSQPRDHGAARQLNRDQGITIVMVTHEPDIAAYARARHPLRRRPHRIATRTTRRRA